MSELKPCPFCSNAGKVNSHPFSPGLYRAWVECESCAASGPPVSSDKSEDEARQLALILWDKRPISYVITYQQKPVEEWVEAEEPGIYRTNIIAPDKLGPSVFLSPGWYTVAEEAPQDEADSLGQLERWQIEEAMDEALEGKDTEEG